MTSTDTSAGAALYFSWILRFVYDRLVLGLYCKYAWGCPTFTKLTGFYNGNVEASVSRSSSHRILDVGVGTGFFLEHAPLNQTEDIVLVDLNTNCLDTAAARTRKAHPHTHCATVHADVLADQPLSSDDLGGQFDAISVMLLLHCLPGPPARKAAALIRLRSLLDEDRGVLFGTTVLGKGVKHNMLGRLIMAWHNSIGVFDNYDDEAQSFIRPLQEAFKSVKWSVVGTMLLFEARDPIL
ncbi:putative methyltransferase type 12 protein [Neofusicoccum parvum]|nr:putative methyltransferase type 12 protein [Neofusicoccum parvum]